MSILKEKLPKSLERVKKFVAKQPEMKGCEIAIYCWPDSKKYGIRVAELGYSKKTEHGIGGGVWMQSDPECGLVCFFAERLALEYDFGGKDEDSLREIENAEFNLHYAMFGKK